jgi:polysaccharide pyruvyl transferase WcaK-like protein
VQGNLFVRVSLCGYYGFRNTGDDALAATIVFGISKCAQEVSFYLQSSRLAMPRGIRTAFSRPIVDRLLWGRDAVRIRDAQCEVHVLGGGSVIHDSFGTEGLRYCRDWYRLLKDKGHRLCAVSVGIGPFLTEEGRSLASEIIRLMDFVAVRDNVSLREVEALGYTSTVLAFDAGVLLPTIGLLEPRRDPFVEMARQIPTIAISLNQVRRTTAESALAGERVCSRVVEAIETLHCTEPVQFWIMTFNDNPQSGDRRLGMRLAKAIRRIDRPCQLIPYNPNPLVTFRRLEACVGVVAMRLHSSIFAFTANVPVAMLAYHEKSWGFAETSQLPSRSVLDAEHFEPRELAQLIDVMITQKERFTWYADSVPVSEAQSRAGKNFDWFRQEMGHE